MRKHREKISRIFLAYDGSINADWVTRYAIRIAANTPNKKLFLLHILDNTYSPEKIRLKIKAIENECTFQRAEHRSGSIQRLHDGLVWGFLDLWSRLCEKKNNKSGFVMFTSGPTKGEILLLEGKVFQFCSRQQPSMGANFDLKRYKYVISVSYDLRQ